MDQQQETAAAGTMAEREVFRSPNLDIAKQLYAQVSQYNLKDILEIGNFLKIIAINKKPWN